jgi:hypothetical protein
MLRGHPDLILDACSVRAKRGGDLTGPNPTDRGKRGTKYHVAVDGAGVPVACLATAANVNDTLAFEHLFLAAFAVMARVGRVSGKSTLAEAIRYALRHWQGLVLFLEDGRLELDTNTIKRAIRPIALGRKNALFAGSDGGAHHWAMVASLVATAKLNGVDPQAWLTDVLE